MLVVLLAAVCWPATLAAAADRPVGMGPASFEPRSITIAPGDRVVWSNTSTRAHTVTSDDGTMFDQAVPPGASYSFTFNQPGTFAYYCRFHGGPGGNGMAGSVVVQGQAATTTTAPPATTAPPQATTTTARPTTTTARATTTTASPTTSTTEPPTTTTPSTTSSTTSTTEPASAPEDDDDDGLPLALIVLALLGVLGAGGYGLWRLWPRPGPPEPPLT